MEILLNQGYRFLSFTIDGRKGILQLLQQMFPGIPVQICLFHQKQIIRRYLTAKPKTDCGQALKKLVDGMLFMEEKTFAEALQNLWDQHHEFLKERNENRQFKHRSLRAAFRSLKTNLPWLFTYKNYPELAIPNTTNSCDGSFAHWKAKVKIHRGLRQHRKHKIVKNLAQNS